MNFWARIVSFLSRRREKPRYPHRPPWWRRWRRLSPLTRLVAVFCLSPLLACGKVEVPPAWRPSLEQVGLLPPAVPKPVMYDGICDGSLNAPCDRERFRSAVEATARAAADRPGSVVRWWMLGATAAATESLGEKVSPPLPTRGVRAQTEAKSRFVKEVSEFYVAAASVALAGKPLRASPLTGSLGKVAISDGHGMPRTILFVTDGREVSENLDLECQATKKLPKPEQWAELVAARRLIAPGSLSGATVFFAYTSVSPTGRTGKCPAASVERTVFTQEMWQAALSRVGAPRVVFASGLPELIPATLSPQAGR